MALDAAEVIARIRQFAKESEKRTTWSNDPDYDMGYEGGAEAVSLDLQDLLDQLENQI